MPTPQRADYTTSTQYARAVRRYHTRQSSIEHSEQSALIESIASTFAYAYPNNTKETNKKLARQLWDTRPNLTLCETH